MSKSKLPQVLRVILIMTKLKSRRQAPTLVILIMGRENYRKGKFSLGKVTLGLL
jgi:hypothetical protein